MSDDRRRRSGTQRQRKKPQPTGGVTAACEGGFSSAQKSPYHQRREELAVLAKQARALEAQLDELRRFAGLPTRDDEAELDVVKARSAEFGDRIHAHDLCLGRAHSLLTKKLIDPVVNPLATFIHLPRDMARRRAILSDLLAVKLRRGVQVATQRLRYLDHMVPYLSEERFETAGGEYHYIRHSIHQFSNFKTARQLYDTLVNLLYNLEISVTEGLGQLAIREDNEDFDSTIWNHRFVTVAEDVGCTEELNLVGFANFHNHSQETKSPMGAIVLDVVNVDELYPYRPHERVCKDIQTVYMAYELRVPGCDEPVVVLKDIQFVVQLPPQFELDAHALRQLQQNCSRWPNFVIKYLHAFVVPDSPGNNSRVTADGG